MLYIGRILDGAMIGFSAPSAQIFVSFSLSFRQLHVMYNDRLIFCSRFLRIIDWRMCIA